LSQKELPKIESSSINKILLIRLRRIGDIIMTTPAISALRSEFPKAHIAYAVEKPYRLLVEGNPNLDKILISPQEKTIRKFIGFVKGVRKERYDLILDFHCGPRASLVTLFSGARLKIGYKIKYRGFIYNRTIPRSKENGYYHSVENHINLVRALGVKVDSLPPLDLPQARKEEEEKIRNFIQDNKLDGSKIIGIHISAGNEFRDWGTENLAQLIKLLTQQEGVTVVLLGEKEDQTAEEEVLKRANLPLLSLVGKLNLRELKEFISHSALFVGSDSGPMHIAASTSTPIVAYFGPTLSAHFSPWKAEAYLIEKDYDCRPCKQKRCLYKDFRCLRSIKPEEVYEACLRFL
jgi:lipopolysaccharide heptosyltransferase II